MVWWCLSRSPSDSPYIRPSRSPSVGSLHFSPTSFDILSWNFAYDFVLMCHRSSLSVLTLCWFLKELSLFLYTRLQMGHIMVWWCPSGSPSVRVSVRPFSTLFSYMLWHIELKFCTSLCFYVLQIKFECSHFASIFMPPAWKVRRGHLVFGSSVRLFVRLSVCLFVRP